MENARNLSAPEKEMVLAFQDFLMAVQKAEEVCTNNLSLVQHAEIVPPTESLLISVDNVDPEPDEPAGGQVFQHTRDILMEAVDSFGRQASNFFVGAETRSLEDSNSLSGVSLAGSGRSGQSLQVGRDPLQRAIYACVAFADERMLALNWSGRQEWLLRPLESELAGSRSAGEKIFKHIEELRVGALGDRSLAVLYLSMLNLGFAGVHAAEGSRSKLPVYRRALFQFIMDDAPDLERVAREFSEAGQALQSPGPVKFMPYLRPWVMVGIGFVLAFIVANQVIWNMHTGELTESILQLSRMMGN